ncbi:hypothetical protein [Thalassobaculum litoreum]|uniref:Uncharacterized protein n=1 Tax=Thalassobaculum litoreum DSM 18839 TaxID=1123362 RepID=A0A8G2BFA9_9PROT|nr:hypothetical protein [Thalassobaculum litoreum]SDF32210.1 hypothetical protein SAMN05660686_01037 [Thalassobaculum litoreum DSM 18839]
MPISAWPKKGWIPTLTIAPKIHCCFHGAMSGRYWLLIIALGGCLAASGTAFSQEPEARQKESESQSDNRNAEQVEQQSAQKANQGTSLVAVDLLERIAVALEAIGTDPYAETTQQRAEKDLHAQSDMAYSAKAMAIIAAVQALLTFVGICYLHWTLAATNAVTKIGQAQISPYTRIRECIFHFYSPQAHPYITVIAQNDGYSPARNFRWNVIIEYNTKEKMSLRGEFNKKWKESHGPSVPPDKTGIKESCMVPNMSIDNFAGKNKHVVVRGKIVFVSEDIFRNVIYGEQFFSGLAVKNDDPHSFGGLMANKYWVCNVQLSARFSDWQD